MHKKNKNNMNLKIRRIDGHYRFALDFFWEYGSEFFKKITYSDNGGIELFRVAFVGFGEYAYELLKVLCALGQLPRCRLIIYIFDKDADIKMQKFQKELLENRVNSTECCLTTKKYVNESRKEILNDIKFHDMPFYEIHFIKEDVENNLFIEDFCGTKNSGPFTHIFLMLGDDAKNINVALNLYREHNRLMIEQSKYYVMVRSDETTLQLKNNMAMNDVYEGIIWIGADSDRYNFKTISEEEIEKLGLAVHRGYAFNKKLIELFKDSKKAIIDDGMPDYESYAYNLIVRELRKDWNYFNVEYFIGDKSRDDYKNTLLWYVHENATEKIRSYLNDKLGYEVNKLIVDKVVKDFSKDNVTKFINEFFDEKKLEDDYNNKEYYRRSSKSRALFEKLMFSLGYLKYIKDKNLLIGRVEPNNVVSEFGINNMDWRLPDKQLNGSLLDQTYAPENIPVYKLRIKNLVYDEICCLYNSYLHAYRSVINEAKNIDKNLKSNKKNNAICEEDALYIYAPHINVQWFEVNNIFQKRWMVFRWSEGFINMHRKQDGEQNLRSKSHKYLVPYIEIYQNSDSRICHTLDVQIKGMADTYGIS